MKYLCKYKYIFKYYFSINKKHFYCTFSNKYNILFFGTDEFSVSSLKLLTGELKKGLVNKLEVVTSVKQHGNQVMQYAKQHDLKIHSWPITLPSENEFDLGIVVSFGNLIPERVINYFPLGMLNVHASLLPKWRGAAPIIHALLNGDSHTGVTIMRIKPKHFDIGEVVLQKTVPISSSILMPQLRDCLANEGANLLIECLKNLHSNLVNAKPQDEGLQTYAPKIIPAIAIVKWHEQTAAQVFNLHRALYGLHSLTTTWQGTSIKLFGCSLIEKEIEINSLFNIKPSCTKVENVKPGFVNYSKNDKLIHVLCEDGQCVTFDSIRLLNKKTISASDFNNGFLKKIDKRKHYFI